MNIVHYSDLPQLVLELYMDSDGMMLIMKLQEIFSFGDGKKLFNSTFRRIPSYARMEY